MEAYCMKCKTKREVNAPEATFNKSGAPVTRGICPYAAQHCIARGAPTRMPAWSPPKAEKPEKVQTRRASW